MRTKLPVAAIIPHKPSPYRDDFFEEYCLPSVEAQVVEKIITVNDVEGKGPGWARNCGANEAFVTTDAKYLLFVDDDVILSRICASELMGALQANPGAAYAYSDWLGIVIPPAKHPSGLIFGNRPPNFNPVMLRRGNYISSAAFMIHKVLYTPFDESLPQLEDWDFFLTLAAKGSGGVRVPKLLYHAYYLDPEGLSSRGYGHEETGRIREKHGIKS